MEKNFLHAWVVFSDSVQLFPENFYHLLVCMGVPMGNPFKPLACVGFALVLQAEGAVAQDTKVFSALFSKVLTQVLLAENYVSVCDERDPGGGEARRQAFSKWHQQNDIATYEAVVGAMLKRVPEQAGKLEQVGVAARKQMASVIGKQPAFCANPATVFSEKNFAVAGIVRDFAVAADALGFRGGETAAQGSEAATTTAAPIGTRLYSLVQLSTLASALGDRAASRAEGAADRDKREGREEMAKVALQGLGVIAVRGRVVDDDEIREWRGEQQSSYDLSCSGFEDDAQEEKFEAAMGQDVVIAGEVRWVHDSDAGGSITLRTCRLLSERAVTGLAAADVPEDGGLMTRPPEAEEVYAGPDKGIAAADVEKVIYKGDFMPTMDGFGNSYTLRTEDTYVLLKSGTAYRHDWPFSFSDLDVEASRRREPERWFEWDASGDDVTLTPTDGGEVVVVENPDELEPMPSAPFDHEYYFLNVGSGGLRQDRTYEFGTDGWVTHTRGGFVAGNVATSYVIVTSDREDRVRSRYRFDGYTLILENEKGETERHFFAAIDSGSWWGQPKNVIVDGQAYWTRED